MPADPSTLADSDDAPPPPATAAGFDLTWLSATELAVLYRSRELSPVDVVRAVLDRLDEVEPKLNAFVTVTREAALQPGAGRRACVPP